MHSNGFYSGSFEHCGSKLAYNLMSTSDKLMFSFSHLQNNGYLQKCYSSEGTIQCSHFLCMFINANTTSQQCGLLSLSATFRRLNLNACMRRTISAPFPSNPNKRLMILSRSNAKTKHDWLKTDLIFNSTSGHVLYLASQSWRRIVNKLEHIKV